jgi:hypothetical protein
MKYASKWNRRWLLFAGVAILSSTPTIAHHGWSWAVDEQTTLQGTIQEISMAPPHPALRVAESNGTVWQVDLGNPNQTARSGFTAQSAKPGDAVAVLGNRHRDEGVKQMKAVRITVGATNYDMYPERIRAK